MITFADLPFETYQSDKRGYGIFNDIIWRNVEVCNGCFTQVRSVGPEHRKWIGASYTSINEWYERTEAGSQEHSPGDSNRRFGTCYCDDCGTTCWGDHRNTPYDGLIPLVKNIFIYTQSETEYDLDHTTLAHEVKQLATLRDATGYETELMAIAFARALTTENTGEEEDSSNARSAQIPAD